MVNRLTIAAHSIGLESIENLPNVVFGGEGPPVHPAVISVLNRFTRAGRGGADINRRYRSELPAPARMRISDIFRRRNVHGFGGGYDMD
jgi:hypothetical protein